ncbi:hypothetical protein Lal_00026014 [Lupinus albus]|uniref:Putative ankyrin repeat-containing domain, PGG domain-containing protein n=1 Tax=Lupinus albus TaxID=3870 RepID=A0A6A4PYW8_LUPAL|nr:putative ankyrin repeat-containing domain, PGG domain-containing protein [Lupinus albus]KAF1861623.1 hypothetical protein Lal_00026014 [Lupinus albus]
MEEMEMEFDPYELRNDTLEGNWNAVIETYKTYREAKDTNIDGDRGTALHVAVNDGIVDTVKLLINVIRKDDIENALKLKNERGDTPLHLAASRGFRKICKLIIGENEERKHLIQERNKLGETPLFLAALSWQKPTFAYLFKVFRNDFVNLRVLIRDYDGDTILHSAIRREFFDLAVIIINYCPKLHDIQNIKGITPLKLLANRPSAFRSGSNLTWWRQIIYYCTDVQEIEPRLTLERYYIKEDEVEAENLHFPENYRTCYEFFISWVAEKLGVGNCKIVSKNKDSVEDEHIKISIPLPSPQPETSQSNAGQVKNKQFRLPPNYATLNIFLMSAYVYVLGLSGAGVKSIRKMKKKHIWGGQLLSAFMQNPSETYMGSGGQPIEQSVYYFEEAFYAFMGQKEEEEKNQNDSDKKQEQQKASNEDSEEEIDPKETAFLIAAKNGIVEMVREILSKIPSALHDTTTEKRNVFHVAVKNRQPLVVETLIKQLTKQNKENMIEAVDKDENTVLHLAAEQLDNETAWKIPGSAMQMMWDITWFKYIKTEVPEHFVFRRNIQDKTAGELFKSNHKELVKESSEWLKETSESCSVVAALIAGVSFATSGTVPGGTDKGKPYLEDRPAFKAFAISSLIGLCFSVTALIMFLSILTSRKQAKDFRRSLPQKLLLGLTSLFVSIVALFVSFCTGHFFVLKNKYRQYVFPIYIATCLPVTFYAIAQFPLYIDLLTAIIRRVPQPSDKGDGL